MSGRSYSYAGPSSMRFRKRKSRFTFAEVQLLLSEVKKNRHLLVGKFNRGVSGDLKKRTWANLAARINEISECPREIIEIIKKWSDLKCDTKRKVAAMRASGFSSSRIAQNLSPVESMVHQILQMPVEKFTFRNYYKEEGEDEHSVSIANGTLPIQSLHSGKSDLGVPLDVMYNESAVPLTDLPLEQSDNEDQGLQFQETGHQSDQSSTSCEPAVAETSQVRAETQQQAPSIISSIAPAAFCQTPKSVLSDPKSLQQHLARSASLSLQEQQATTVLLGTLSRSLETLSESVQQLVQTQKQFSRDTLRMQRDTLHVLRDFSSSALALLQDKNNGHPYQL